MALKNRPRSLKSTVDEGSEIGRGERDDCTVHALVNTTALTYDEAHAILAAAGRKRNDGFHPDTFFRRNPVVAGHTFTKVKALSKPGATSPGWGLRNQFTVNQFIRNNPTGRFYVTTRRHAFAVVDGVAIDNSPRPRFLRRVEDAWAVTMD